MLFLVPLVWGLLRRSHGLPMFGPPSVAQLEDPSYKAGIFGMKKVDAPVEDPSGTPTQGTVTLTTSRGHELSSGHRPRLAWHRCPEERPNT